MLQPKLPFGRSWFWIGLRVRTLPCCGQGPGATKHNCWLQSKKRMCSILRYYWYTQVERKLHIPHLPSRPRGRTADVPNSFQDLLPSKLLVGLGQEALVFLNMQNSEHKTGNIANYPVSSMRAFLAHHAQAKGHRSPFWFGHICYE